MVKDWEVAVPNQQSEEELRVLRMPEKPEKSSEEQKQEQSVQHDDSSTAKQIQLDEIYAEILQNIEDQQGAMRLHMEEKERVDDEKKED